MHHRGSNPGPFAWKVRTLRVDRPRQLIPRQLIVCTYYSKLHYSCHTFREEAVALWVRYE